MAPTRPSRCSSSPGHDTSNTLQPNTTTKDTVDSSVNSPRYPIKRDFDQPPPAMMHPSHAFSYGHTTTPRPNPYFVPVQSPSVHPSSHPHHHHHQHQHFVNHPHPYRRISSPGHSSMVSPHTYPSNFVGQMYMPGPTHQAPHGQPMSMMAVPSGANPPIANPMHPSMHPSPLVSIHHREGYPPVSSTHPSGPFGASAVIHPYHSQPQTSYAPPSHYPSTSRSQSNMSMLVHPDDSRLRSPQDEEKKAMHPMDPNFLQRSEAWKGPKSSELSRTNPDGPGMVRTEHSGPNTSNVEPLNPHATTPRGPETNTSNAAFTGYRLSSSNHPGNNVGHPYPQHYRHPSYGVPGSQPVKAETFNSDSDSFQSELPRSVNAAAHNASSSTRTSLPVMYTGIQSVNTNERRTTPLSSATISGHFVHRATQPEAGYHVQNPSESSYPSIQRAGALTLTTLPSPHMGPVPSCKMSRTRSSSYYSPVLSKMEIWKMEPSRYPREGSPAKKPRIEGPEQASGRGVSTGSRAPPTPSASSIGYILERDPRGSKDSEEDSMQRQPPLLSALSASSAPQGSSATVSQSNESEWDRQNRMTTRNSFSDRNYEQEWNALREVFGRSLTKSYVQYGLLDPENPQSISDFEKYLNSSFEKIRYTCENASEKSDLFVMEVDERIVGFAQVIHEETVEFGTMDSGNVASIIHRSDAEREKLDRERRNASSGGANGSSNEANHGKRGLSVALSTYISQMVVDPLYQCGGLGHSLGNTCFRAADARGSSLVWTIVRKRDEAASLFCESVARGIQRRALIPQSATAAAPSSSSPSSNSKVAAMLSQVWMAPNSRQNPLSHGKPCYVKIPLIMEKDGYHANEFVGVGWSLSG